MKKKNNAIDFKVVLQNKRIPILTLDEKWHELFPDYDKPPHIRELEKELNDLMKTQGQKVNDIKEMKALKKKLMEDIVKNMDVANGEVKGLKVKKQMKNQQLIQEINEKLRESDDNLVDIPYLIKEKNEQLLLESMKVCYERLKHNRSEIDKYNDWIIKVREELKNRILVKQDMEMKNTAIYAYMHDMLGAEVLELLDNQEGLGK